MLAHALRQAREARLIVLEVMNKAIDAPRASVKPNAPKIVTFEIPLDRIGEVIGPKGKVINTIQQETGADLAVDDDGTVGRVTIGAKESSAVEEARRRVELILNPPAAEIGKVYDGKVVNITKFGAFVNILPGRDGLLHISRIGGGKRIDRVEDVLSLGDPVKVIVEDIDPQGKVSLSLVGEDGEPIGGSREARAPEGGNGRETRPSSRERVPRAEVDEAPEGVRRVSFEDEFAREIEGAFGDLGPGGVPSGGESRASGPRRRGRPRR